MEMTDRCVIPSQPRPQSNNLGSYTKVTRQQGQQVPPSMAIWIPFYHSIMDIRNVPG